MYIIATGVVTVTRAGAKLKEYKVGDYFGETSLVMGRPRNADVTTKTPCVLIEIERADFMNFFRGSDVPARLERLAKMREEKSWEVIQQNSVLRVFTSAQKTQLQSLMELQPTRNGDFLWRVGEKPTGAWLIDEGCVTLEGAGSLAPFTTGALLADFDAIRGNLPSESSARVSEAGRLFRITAENLMSFFADNPGALISFLGARFVE